MFNPAKFEALKSAYITFGLPEQWAPLFIHVVEKDGYCKLPHTSPQHPDYEARRTAIAKLRLLGIEVRGWDD